MKQKLLHNPYLVMWAYDHEKWEELKAWIAEGHLTSKFQLIGTGRGALMVTLDEDQNLVGYEINKDPHGYWKEGDELVAMALFECSKDALLFKLTWVE